MKIIALLLAATFMFMAISPIFAQAEYVEPGGAKFGPYVDKIVYNVITQADQQVLALQDDEIDLIGDFVNPTFLETLVDAEGIEVVRTLRNGYGYMTLNCAKYPLNISAFRRAVAFAVDKEGISDTCWDGLSEPLDSVIPKINPWSIEGQLDYSYYESNIARGNYLLDQAGFTVNKTTGFRTAPNGDSFSILVECQQSSNIAIECGQYFEDALIALGVNATSEATDFWYYLNKLYNHEDYDMVFLGTSFSNFDADWLAYEFWSEYADEPYQNFAMFRNATYDSWRDQLLYSTDYDDVYEAAIEMQRILTYECPVIIAYQNHLLSAHRTDRFEGFENDALYGIADWWTAYGSNLKASEGGPYGGTLRISNPLSIATFNFMLTHHRHLSDILLWDSLLKHDADGNIIPWLAESYTIETHADNSEITPGHTRITFKIHDAAVWTDGTPLTAEDVAFSIWFYREGTGNPYGADLQTMTSCYSTATEVIAEFDTESYWNIRTISFKPIIPKHIFESINPDDWNWWNPDPRNAPMVTSGPFNVSDYVAGEYMELSRNPNYFYISPMDSPIVENVTSTDTVSPFTFPLSPVGLLITTSSSIIIMGVFVLWRKEMLNIKQS